MQGEDGTMFPTSCHKMYFAGPLESQKYSFFRPQYKHKHLMPELLQSLASICSFYTIYAAFHLFKFQEHAITVVHDVNFLSFMSGNMYFFNLFNVYVQFRQGFG